MAVAKSRGSAQLCVSNGLGRSLTVQGRCFGKKGSSVGCIHALMFPLRGTKGFGDSVHGIRILGCYGSRV